MNLKLKYFIICVVSVVVLTSNAQQTTYLSLKSALEKAKGRNSSLKLSELEYKIAKSNYRQTDAVFLPQVTVGLNAMSTNNPLNAFGFLLQQSVVTSLDFDPAKLNNPGSRQNYSAGVDVRVPILNLDMYYARKGAKLQQKAYEYKNMYTADNVDYEIRKTYHQLQFAYMSNEILQSTLEDMKQIYKSVTGFYKQGLIQQSDVLNAQVQINIIESALQKSKSSIGDASDGLAFLMGDTLSGVSFVPDSLVQMAEERCFPDLLTERSDIKAMDMGVKASDMMVKSSRMNFLPKINAWGNFQYNDKKLLRFDSNSYMIGVNMSWTLFSGNQNRYKLKSAILQRDKYQLEKEQYVDRSRLEIERISRELKNLDFEIKMGKASVAKAEEAFRIMQNRFREGLVSTSDLLTSQAQLSQQRLLLAQSVMNYDITLSYHNFITNNK
jgi:outer membrane protein TolC